jgi:hypothetical protein
VLYRARALLIANASSVGSRFWYKLYEFRPFAFELFCVPNYLLPPPRERLRGQERFLVDDNSVGVSIGSTESFDSNESND